MEGKREGQGREPHFRMPYVLMGRRVFADFGGSVSLHVFVCLPLPSSEGCLCPQNDSFLLTFCGSSFLEVGNEGCIFGPLL